MDLLGHLLAHPEIALYLRDYPQSQWVSVLRCTVLYGIASLQALKTAGLSVNVLEGPEIPSIVPGLKEKLRGVKGQLDEIDRCLDEASASFIRSNSVLRSSSAPSRAKSEKRVQPKQPNGRKDYAPLIYPEWWPTDSSSASSRTLPTKHQVKPKVYVQRGKSSVSPPQCAKPLTKTVGTSTSASNPSFCSSSKPLKIVVPPSTPPKLLVSPSYLLRPELKDTNPRLPVAASISGSSRDSMIRPSVPSEDSDRVKSVRQHLATTWAGDYSSFVKRSPAKSSDDRSSQESREKASLRGLSKKREEVDTKEKHDTSSDSSISTYRPSEELKAFFRSEHDRLCPQNTSVSGQPLSDSSGFQDDADSFTRY